MHIIIETPRLLLRRFNNDETDAALIWQLNSQPDVLKYLHEPTLNNIAEAQKVLENIILPQYDKNLGRWALHQKVNGQFIGWCGLKHRPELNEIDLGYRLAPSAWGKGYATEAAAATLEYAFEMLQIAEVVGRAHIDNLASISVLKKIGMKYQKDDLIDDAPHQLFLASYPQAISQ